MNESLRDHFNKSQKYLKIRGGETFKGFYVGWEPITNSFGSKAYRFTFEREDGTRVQWDCGNSKAILQISDMLDKGFKRGGVIEIHREGNDKEDTRYEIKEGVSF